jgi:threonine synthase
MIVLETALPIKFAATIVEALGQAPQCPPKLVGIEHLPRRVTLLAKDVAAVQAFIVNECGK